MALFRRRDAATYEDPLTLPPTAITRIYSIWVSLTYPFPSKIHNLSIHHSCDLKKALAPRTKIGNLLIIQEGAWLNVSLVGDGMSEPVITVEDNCRIGHWCQISGRNSIHVERDVILSPLTPVMDHSHGCEGIAVAICAQGVTEGLGIRIGQGSWIGQEAATACAQGELMLDPDCVVMRTHSSPEAAHRTP